MMWALFWDWWEGAKSGSVLRTCSIPAASPGTRLDSTVPNSIRNGSPIAGHAGESDRGSMAFRPGQRQTAAASTTTSQMTGVCTKKESSELPVRLLPSVGNFGHTRSAKARKPDHSGRRKTVTKLRCSPAGCHAVCISTAIRSKRATIQRRMSRPGPTSLGRCKGVRHERELGRNNGV